MLVFWKLPAAGVWWELCRAIWTLGLQPQSQQFIRYSRLPFFCLIWAQDPSLCCGDMQNLCQLVWLCSCSVSPALLTVKSHRKQSPHSVPLTQLIWDVRSWFYSSAPYNIVCAEPNINLQGMLLSAPLQVASLVGKNRRNQGSFVLICESHISRLQGVLREAEVVGAVQKHTEK